MDQLSDTTKCFSSDDSYKILTSTLVADGRIFWGRAQAYHCLCMNGGLCSHDDDDNEDVA